MKDLEKGGLIFDFCLCQKQEILAEKPAENRHEAQENTKQMKVIAGGENPMKEQSYP